MAYNPFDFFRKNQKIFFAVLTIIVMFMFVLSFGQGDFFQWFPRWLEQQRSYGDVLAEVGGKRVRDSDLGAVAKKRQLANAFMSQAAELELRELAKRVQEYQFGTKMSEDARRVLQQVQTQKQIASFKLQQATGEEVLEQYRQTLLQCQGELARAANKPGVRDDDRDALLTAARLCRAEVTQLARLTTVRRNEREGGVYFANMPNRTSKDQLEYLLWLKKADQFGIRYTADDVTGLVQAELPEVAGRVPQLMAEMTTDKRLPTDALTDALADEFRVRAAQAAVLGTEAVRAFGGVPAAVPFDLYEFYKQETGRTRFAFVTVPVEPFMAQVTGEPTDAELKQIFKDYRSTDPEPHNPKSGIRDPRKVKVEWVEVTGEEPYYQPLAAERLKKQTLARQVAEKDEARAVLGVAAPVAGRDTVYEEYEKKQAEVTKGWAAARSNPGRPRIPEAVAAVTGAVIQGDPLNATRRNPFDPSFAEPAPLADASVARPHNVGVLAGLLGGAFATGGSPLTAPVLIAEAGYAAEKEQRLVTGVQAFHFPTLSGLATLGELTGADMAVLAGLPRPLPQPVVQPALDQQSKVRLRYLVAEEDLRALDTKLAEIMKQSDTAAATKQAAEYVAQFIKDRGLKSGRTTTLRDLHTIADEPGLEPLVAKSGRADPIFGTLTTPLRKSEFGATLFRAPKPTAGRERGGWADSVGVYDPFPYPPTDDAAVSVGYARPQLMAWRTEDVKAETPKEFSDEVRARCVQVWKRLKARDLARKAADEVTAEVKKAGESPALVNKHLQDAVAALKAKFPNPADQARVKLIDKPEYEVAKLVRETSVQASMAPALRPFFLLPNDDFVYPTPKVTEELIARRTGPVGSGVVLADLPETTYYAAVVTGKDEAGYTLFRDTIYLGRPAEFSFASTAKETVESRYAMDARKRAREEAVALLKAEFGYANENPNLDKRANEGGD